VGKRWTWVAWSMLAVFVVSMVFTTLLTVANGTFQQDPAGFVVLVLGFGAFMVVGALVVAHRPSNAIGWIFSAVGLLSITGALAAEYATYALVTPGPGRCRARSLPLGMPPGRGIRPLPWRWSLPPCCSRPVGCSRPAGDPPPGWPGRRRRRSPCWPLSDPISVRPQTM
jgi:hypothetical protein